jgi:hypothetical protein
MRFFISSTGYAFGAPHFDRDWSILVATHLITASISTFAVWVVGFEGHLAAVAPDWKGPAIAVNHLLL